MEGTSGNATMKGTQPVHLTNKASKGHPRFLRIYHRFFLSHCFKMPQKPLKHESHWSAEMCIASPLSSRHTCVPLCTC